MATIHEKILEVQKDLPDVVKDSKNPHFKNTYVSLSALMSVVLPALQAKGLLLTQTPGYILAAPAPPEPALITQITDPESGDSIGGAMPLMLEKHNPQGLGSAITYARRYALMSILGIVADEDDDGNSASQRAVASAPTRRASTTGDF